MHHKRFLAAAIAAVFLVPAYAAHADACPTGIQQSALTPSQRAQCEADLAQVQREIADNQAQLAATQAQSASLSRDISILDGQIKDAQLKIQAATLLIQTLGQNITEKQAAITGLEAQIDRGHRSLAEILASVYETGDASVPRALLSADGISSAMRNFDDFQSVQNALALAFEQLRATEVKTQTEKAQLTDRQNREIDARQVIQTQQNAVKEAQAQKQQLLSVSKNSEASYQQVLAQKQQKAAQIRAALFNLAGAGAIPFGDALAYANTVYAKTGVPQAFLLAILTQETGIGKNVGTCYLTNTGDGSGVNAKTGIAIANVMKPSRDVSPFLSIADALGVDYKSQPVSCPQSIGYGGGMGPAQFIASTWMLLKNRIASALGITSMPNPWSPQSAFMAAGIYLSDLGAGSSSYSAQKNAACRYYSGRACGYVTGATSYGNSVMALANGIQVNQINPLQNL